jgi:hypothetical protein
MQRSVNRRNEIEKRRVAKSIISSICHRTRVVNAYVYSDITCAARLGGLCIHEYNRHKSIVIPLSLCSRSLLRILTRIKNSAFAFSCGWNTRRVSRYDWARTQRRNEQRISFFNILFPCDVPTALDIHPRNKFTLLLAFIILAPVMILICHPRAAQDVR